MNREFAKFVAPMQRKLGQVVARGVLRLVDDALKLQGLQVTLLADETLDGVERFQQYGFTSHPFDGAEVIALSANGHRSHAIVIAVDDRRYRLTGLEQGEVALYTDENDAGEGMRIVLKRDRTIEIRCDKLQITAETEATLDTEKFTVTASDKITLDSPEVEIPNGDLNVTTGDVTAAAGDVVAGTISLKTHTHSGVQPGSGDSGPPVP